MMVCDVVQTGLSGGASLKEAGTPVASDKPATAGDPSPSSPPQAATSTPSPQVVTSAPQEPVPDSRPPPFSLMQPRAAQPPLPVVMPAAFGGLQDPFWALLLTHIVQVRACLTTICSDASTSNKRRQSSLHAAEGAAALCLPYMCCRVPAALNDLQDPFWALLLTHNVSVNCSCWCATVGSTAVADCMLS